MTTYKLATEYQQDTLKKIVDRAETAKLGDMQFFWNDRTKHVSLQAVWLTDEAVAVRNINSGIETSWRCINGTRGIRFAYTRLCGGEVEE